MSYLLTDSNTKVYVADFDWVPDRYASPLYIQYKNTPTYLKDLFPNPAIGDKVTFSNNSRIEISNISDNNVYFQFYNSLGVGVNGAFGSYSNIAQASEYYSFIAYNNVDNLIYVAFVQQHSYPYSGVEVTPYELCIRTSSAGTEPAYMTSFLYGGAYASPVYQALTESLHVSVYFPGEESEIGGGTGSFDATSDAIDFPSPPTLSAVTAGFITLFTPTISQLNSLASYMWSSAFDLDTFKKLFADPMDAIIGLSIIPVSVPISGSASVKIGFIDTGISMSLASSQYATIDCGTLTPAEYWGSALDYSPYTKFSIHLPYIGTRELNTDDIMGKTLQVVYNIDILSGACTAMIKCGSSVLYEFSGACATSIPLTGQNWTQLITSCIQLAGAGIAVAATGGSAAGLLPSTANAVMAMKPNIQRTGVVSGSAGMLGIQQPYLIWELPRQSLAGDYNKFVGYPSNITALLSTLTGYTQIESVHLENIPATQSELAEIETLLKEGVII